MCDNPPLDEFHIKHVIKGLHLEAIATPEHDRACLLNKAVNIIEFQQTKLKEAMGEGWLRLDEPPQAMRECMTKTFAVVHLRTRFAFGK